jgi:outer membrane immunogenic protein
MYAPNWSLKVEYDYFDFGNPNEPFPGPGGFFGAKTRDRIQTVLVGLNYRFGSR